MVLALTGGTLIAASQIFQPSPSAADVGFVGGANAWNRAPFSGRPAPDHKPTPRRQLGELHGNEFRLIVHASDLGPRYTVISPEGVLLAEDLSAAEVATDFPGLQLDLMTADAPDEPFGAPDW